MAVGAGVGAAVRVGAAVGSWAGVAGSGAGVGAATSGEAQPAAAPPARVVITLRRAGLPAGICVVWHTPCCLRRLMRDPGTPQAGGRLERDELRVPVAEERLAVETRPHVIGEVLLRRTVSEDVQTVTLDVARETLRVTRRNVAPRPALPVETEHAFSAETRRIPVLGERAVAAKRPFVTGEVVVHRRPVVERRIVTETVRHVVVEPDVTAALSGEGAELKGVVAEVAEPDGESREIVPAPVEKLGAVWREVKEGFTRGRTRS